MSVCLLISVWGSLGSLIHCNTPWDIQPPVSTDTHFYMRTHTHFYSIFSLCSPPLPLCADRELFQSRPLKMLSCCLPNTDMLKDTPPLLTLFFSPHPSYIVHFTLSLCHSAALSLSLRWTWSQFSVCSALWCHSVNLLSASISWPELGWKVRKSTAKSTIHEKHKWEHWSLDSNNTGVYKGYHISATRGFMSLAQNSGPTSTAIQSSIFVALLHTSALYTQSHFIFFYSGPTPLSVWRDPSLLRWI